MQIKNMQLGMIGTNCYIFWADGSDRCAVVDPGDDGQQVANLIQGLKLTPVAILLTHSHFDHVLGIPGLRETWPDLPVYCHPADIPEDVSETMFGMATGGRKPYFDIKVDAQKASPFSRAAQNELALQLYSAGFFAPEYSTAASVAVEMMQFEGKDTIQQKISQNGTLLQENTQLKQYVVQLAQQLALTGDAQTVALANAIAQKFGGEEQQGAAVAGGINTTQADTDSLGNMHSTATKTDRVKKQTQERTEVQ